MNEMFNDLDILAIKMEIIFQNNVDVYKNKSIFLFHYGNKTSTNYCKTYTFFDSTLSYKCLTFKGIFYNIKVNYYYFMKIKNF